MRLNDAAYELQREAAKDRRGFTDAQVIAAIDGGDTIGELTDRFKCHARVIQRIARGAKRNIRKAVNGNGIVWDDAIIAKLRTLWAEGHSTAEIGRRLGASKNAIVGKAHRLDLEERPSPIRRENGVIAAPRAPRLRLTTLPPLPSEKTPEERRVLIAAVAKKVAAAMLPEVRPSPALSAPVATLPAPVPEAVRPPPVAPEQVRRPSLDCCWPIGEPGTKTFRFCDDVSIPGKPYCDEHAKLAYVRIRGPKEDA
jgi:GcrA cell cycle regulator